MALVVVRALFVLVAAGLAASLIGPGQDSFFGEPLRVFGGIMFLALGLIALDIFIPIKRIDTITAVYFGLLMGFLLTYVLGLALTPYFPNSPYELRAVQAILGLVVVYTSTSFVLQTKDDFRFIIPYVEFAREVKGLKPYVLDTSVIIDGRIADVADTHILDNQLVMPRFALAELQNIADSSDKLRRDRGRRGLDILNRLRNHSEIDFTIYERELPEMAGQTVDMKLVLLTRHLEGKLVTGDYNLNKVARLHNVPVINLNDVANALKPVYIPGEGVEVKIVKPGEEQGQGVGYLEDGTMIVVEGARDHLNEVVDMEVTSVLQTSAGRMIFGRLAGGAVSQSTETAESESKEESHQKIPSKKTG